MRERWGVPSKFAWLSGFCLYGALLAWSALLAFTIPLLLELMRVSPRLAMLGILGVLVAPAPVIAFVHHAASGVLDLADRGDGERARGALPGASSWWAGVLSWCALFAVSTATSVVLLVIFPPEPEPDVLGVLSLALSYASGSLRSGVHAVVWITIAAQIYELERRAKKK
jgi:hypothetical protein